MKNSNIITVRAAVQHLHNTGENSGKYVFLSDLQLLCNQDGKKPKAKQGWTFYGDWKRSVQPYYGQHA
jgi:hypothetical protein